MSQKPKLIYRHFHTPDIHGKSITCVFRFDDDSPEWAIQKRVTIAWSLCHEDDNFDRSVGRKIALARLNKGDSVVGIHHVSQSLDETFLETLADTYASVPIHFFKQTIDALEFYQLSQQQQEDIKYRHYANSLGWYDRLMMFLIRKFM